MARPKTLIAVFAAIVIAAAGCTMNKQEAPGLTGPSEQGTSLQMIANPDVLTQDGGSQSAITVIARGPNGQPLAGLSIRADVTFNGAVTDAMGRLSARNIVTDGNGRADVVYTAPLAPDAGEAFVAIQFIPVGTDAANTLARTVAIRLLPEGSVGGGSDIQAVIDASATTVDVGEEVVFDGTGSTSSTGVASFKWDFDDGHKAGDPIEVHSFSSPGSYNVELTVIDPYGNSNTAHVTITVGALAPPVASFTWLPTAPTTSTPVTFDASGSSAASGHSIVRYEWDFGDGETANTTNPVVVKQNLYSTATSYTVILTVTDDTGQKSSTTRSIPIS